MSDYNWCHGPKCHTNHTVDRIRGTKGNKVLRTRKVKIGFASDVQVNVAGQWLDLVNKASYTREDGTTQTTLGVFAEQINNVVNIYGGYTDNCGVRHQSQLSVKVVNNF